MLVRTFIIGIIYLAGSIGVPDQRDPLQASMQGT